MRGRRSSSALSRRSFLGAAAGAHGIEPENAPDAGVVVEIGPARPVMLAPEGYREWGLYQFPSIWRLRSGRLVCAVALGEDEMPSVADYHYLWYISDDHGLNWRHAAASNAEAKTFLRERFTLPDGRQVYFEPKISAAGGLNAKPIVAGAGEFPALVRGVSVLYRLGDLPEEDRSVTLYSREANEQTWQTSTAAMDPDILVPVFTETVVDKQDTDLLAGAQLATRLRALIRHTGDARLPAPLLHKHYASKWASVADLQSPAANTVARIQVPTPAGLPLHNLSLEPVLSAGGELLVSTKRGRLRLAKAPGGVDTGLYPNIFGSRDGGRTWSYRSSVPYSNHGEYVIARAHLTVNMPSGNWMALIRTGGPKGTASCPLLVSRSYDRGGTWTTPVEIRTGSANPVGGILPNGVAFRLYGRPGQFVTFCGDGEGKAWGNDAVLVPAVRQTGPPKRESENTGFVENSCCNSSVQVTGPDRFVVVYSDYDYRDRTGTLRKAIVSREIVARARRSV